MIWTLILKYAANLKVWTGVGFCLLAVFAGVQSARLSHAKADLSAARAALIDPATKKTWRAEAAADATSLAVAEAALDTQGAAVATLKAAGQASTSRAAAAAQAAQVGARAADDQAAKVLAAPPGADGCKSADALILSSLGGPR